MSPETKIPGIPALQKVKETHCGYLLGLITKQCDQEGFQYTREQFHYTADGCAAMLRDHDGQKYRIDIVPVYDKGDTPCHDQ
jgi:hypothetical protein